MTSDSDAISPNVQDSLLAQRLKEMAAEVKPVVHDERVKSYEVFQTALSPNVSVVYHPSSATDMSPSVAFPDSRVIYADLSDASMAALRSAGEEAHTADATTFDPGEVDVLILQNPGITSEVPAAHVKVGGYVLANDYHGNATQLHLDPNFALLGTIHNRTPDGAYVFDNESPENYWKVVTNDEQFRASPGYDAVGILSSRITGTMTPSYEEYVAAIELIKAMPGGTLDGNFRVFPDGKVLPVGMPTQSGDIDDLFVFRRQEASGGYEGPEAAALGSVAVTHA